MEESIIITELQRLSECVGHESYMHGQEYDTVGRNKQPARDGDETGENELRDKR